MCSSDLEGYFPVPPTDHLMNLRNEMMQTLIDCGITVECQHHEVGTAGQAECRPDGGQGSPAEIGNV